MTWETWIAFCVLETVLCITPGPAVLFVVSTTMSRGPRAALSGAAGIVAANTVYFALSALGVAAIILASNFLFTILKWGGAAYLVWLGIRMLWSQEREGSVDAQGAAPPALSVSFLRGFAVQAANPKALAFFVALLPQFVNPQVSVLYQVFILGATSVVIEMGVLASYVWLVSSARAYASGRWAAAVRRIAGGLLVAAGARLALASR
jgi:threonine/homoserine/homoserine lactone efflux protein